MTFLSGTTGCTILRSAFLRTKRREEEVLAKARRNAKDAKKKERKNAKISNNDFAPLRLCEGKYRRSEMKKAIFAMAVLAAVACVCFFAACSESGTDSGDDPGKTTGGLVENAFKVFDSFKATNYTPPAGYDVLSSATGTVKELTYFSTTTGVNRKVSVYTPPGYDEGTAYPVLFLLHGGGGDHKEWVDGYAQGDGVYANLNAIMSNLINAKKAKPMIVVVPNVRAAKNDAPNVLSNDDNRAAFENFINDLEKDLMPFIQEKYIISEDRDQHAVAGLSLGGMESVNIGLSKYGYENFGYVGAFSAAYATVPITNITDEYKEKTFFMLVVGTEDDLIPIEAMQEYRDEFKKNGINPAYYEIPGGKHGFLVWNGALYHFAQCIFTE